MICKEIEILLTAQAIFNIYHIIKMLNQVVTKLCKFGRCSTVQQSKLNLYHKIVTIACQQPVYH